MNTNVLIFLTILIFLLHNSAQSKFSQSSLYRPGSLEYMTENSESREPTRMNFKPLPKFKFNDEKPYKFNDEKQLKVNDEKQQTGLRDQRQFSNKRDCAIVYMDEEPIGILQPFDESYRLLPVNINNNKVLVDLDSKVPYKRVSRYDQGFDDMNIENKMGNENAVENKQPIISQRSLKPGIVEEELKDILDDMGLIDDKRETFKRDIKEDENLDQGENKIRLIKADERMRRHEQADVERSDESSNIADSISDNDAEPEEKMNNKRDIDAAIGDYKSAKHSQSEVTEYEKRVERDIQNKIKALKEEVKREIETLKNDKSESQATEDASRKKRQVGNTLIDAEIKLIDPNLNIDEKLEPHVRRRRNIQNVSNSNIAINNKTETKIELQEPNNTDKTSHFQLRQLKQFDKEDERTDLEINKNNELNTKDDSVNEVNDRDDNNKMEESDVSKRKIDADLSYEDNLVSEADNFQGNKCHEKWLKWRNSENNKISQYPNSRSSYLSSPNELLEDQSNYLINENAMDRNKAVFRRSYPDYKRLKRKDVFIPSINNEMNYEDYDNSYDAYKLVKRNADRGSMENIKTRAAPNYFIDLHPNVYRLSPYVSEDALKTDESFREKRDNFQQLERMDSPMQNHLVAIKRRSMFQPVPRYRRRIFTNPKQQPQQLVDMSEEDIFGALPQSFEGELSRYKRVKRSAIKK